MGGGGLGFEETREEGGQNNFVSERMLAGEGRAEKRGIGGIGSVWRWQGGNGLTPQCTSTNQGNEGRPEKRDESCSLESDAGKRRGSPGVNFPRGVSSRRAR